MSHSLDHPDRRNRPGAARLLQPWALVGPEQQRIGRPALAGRSCFQAPFKGAGEQPRRPVRPCRRNSAASARRHGPPGRRRDRERAVLRVRGPRRIAPRGRDAPGSPLRPSGAPPARDRPPRLVRLASAAARRSRGPARAARAARRAAGADRLRLPPEPCGARRGDRADGRPHRVADARPDALPARRRASRDRRRRAGIAQQDLGRGGAPLALLAALRHEFRRARTASGACWPTVCGRSHPRSGRPSSSRCSRSA